MSGTAVDKAKAELKSQLYHFLSVAFVSYLTSPFLSCVLNEMSIILPIPHRFCW